MSDHVFICYARDDQDFVIKLASELKDRKINVWLDQWNISAGADWDMEVDNALYECSKFLIVLSPSSTIARGAHLLALRENGLQVKRVHGDFTVAPVQGTDSPTEVGPVDLVMVCVKTPDMDRAALLPIELKARNRLAQ